MRILQIHSGINLNGAVRYAALVSRLLALRGHEIVILQRPVVDLGSVVARAAAQFSADVNIPKLEAILAEAAGRA